MNKSEMAKRVYELSTEMRRLEKEAKELKEALKEAGSGKYGDYVVSIVEAERESFKLKDAKAGVTEAVWNKIKGFVNVTSYKTVKVVKA